MLKLLFRSGKWRRLRKAFIAKNPTCALCGGTSKLEVHHCIPVSVDRSLELDENNLVVLCESKSKGVNCHLFAGHLGSYKRYNPNVLEDVRVWAEKLRGKMAEVRFIRKNGRIIPIRSNKTRNTGLAVMGAGAGGLATSKYLGKVALAASQKAHRGSSEAGRAVPQTFREFYKAAGNPIMKDGFHTAATLNRGRGAVRKEYSRPTIHIGSMASESAVLHEVGHIRSSRRKFSMNRFMRSQAILGARITKGKKVSATQHKIHRWAKKARTFTDLISEAEATGEAMGAVYKKRGLKDSLRMGKSMGMPYATYAAGAGKKFFPVLIGLGAVTAIGGAVMNRRKK